MKPWDGTKLYLSNYTTPTFVITSPTSQYIKQSGDNTSHWMSVLRNDRPYMDIVDIILFDNHSVY